MNLAHVYASALVSSPEGDKAVASLVTHLQARGRMKLLPRILRELTELRERSQAVAPTLTVASEAEKAQALTDSAALGFTPDTVVIDPTLIKGWRATKKGQLIDRSGKRALTDLYRNITT
ncbi:F0F1 ATP synthase subunit delta [Patescibacteria group bacterium]|nr:F0F1 ATP synthase subunit delta [Patescibacteria group bacterium]MBU1754681.1 F0F1 ATP synthase subunit delta [Patescibacteria group bacterium]